MAGPPPLGARIGTLAALSSALVLVLAIVFALASLTTRAPNEPPPAWLDVGLFAILWGYALLTPIAGVLALVLAPRWAKLLALAMLGLWIVALSAAVVLPFLG